MLRVALLSNTAGLGGEDSMALGLTKHCKNIDWSGIFVERRFENNAQSRRARNWGGPYPLYQPTSPENKFPEFKGVKYLDDFYGSLIRVCNDSDLVISYLLQPTVDHSPLFECIETPIVNYVQGNEEFVKQVCHTVAPYITNNVISNEATQKCLPFDSRDDAVVIPSAVELERCFPKFNPQALRSLWGIEKHQKVLLFLSRVEDEKNPEAVIQALLNLPEEWVCVVQGHGSYTDTLIHAASKYIPNRMIVVEDPWLHPGDIFSITDVFFLATDAEGDPIVIKEAMVAGLPIVTTQLPYLKSYQDQFGELAITVPSRATGELLANAVLTADSQKYRSTAVPQVQAMAVNNFNWARISQLWEDYMYSVVYNHFQRLRFPKAEIIAGERPLNIASHIIPESPESSLNNSEESMESEEVEEQRASEEVSESPA